MGTYVKTASPYEMNFSKFGLYYFRHIGLRVYVWEPYFNNPVTNVRPPL
jgi:hypothetical protein